MFLFKKWNHFVFCLIIATWIPIQVMEWMYFVYLKMIKLFLLWLNIIIILKFLGLLILEIIGAQSLFQFTVKPPDSVFPQQTRWNLMVENWILIWECFIYSLVYFVNFLTIIIGMNKFENNSYKITWSESHRNNNIRLFSQFTWCLLTWTNWNRFIG